MDKEELARKAAALGLQKAAASYPADLQAALDRGTELAGSLPRDIHWSEEPAHTFSLVPRRKERT